MSDLVIPPRNELFEAFIQNELDEVWHFGAGDPEYWKFSDQLLKPGGTVLDVGAETGRSSVYFALGGMCVTALDLELYTPLAEMADDFQAVIPGSIECVQGDIATADLPAGSFDTVILSYLIHMESRERLLGAVARSYEMVKPGGHMYTRLLGKYASGYEDMLRSSEYDSQLKVVDEHVIQHPCTCSGVYQMDPTVFLDPLDVHSLLVNHGAEITHSQTLPTNGHANIMLGEDYNVGIPVRRGGMITVIAQKPE